MPQLVAPLPALLAPAPRQTNAQLVTTGTRADLAQALAEALEHPADGPGCSCHLRVAGEPDELPALAQEAARAAGADGILIAVGGDGTINTLAQVAWEHDLPLAVLACGTFNFFAREHGLPDEPAEAARAILDTLHHGSPKPVLAGRVNERLFLVNASLGLYPRLLIEREQASQRFGRHRMVALLSALVTLVRGVRYKQFTLSAQSGVPEPGHATSIFVGRNALQLEQLGVADSPAVAAGALGVVVHQPESRWSLAALLLRAARGAMGEHPQITSFPARTLEIGARQAGRRSHVWVACDGETARMQLPLSFSVESRPLRLIAPREALGHASAPQHDGRAA